MGLFSHRQQCEEHVTLLGKFVIVEVDYMCIKYEVWHVLLMNFVIVSCYIFCPIFCDFNVDLCFFSFVNICLIFMQKISLHLDVYWVFGV